VTGEICKRLGENRVFAASDIPLIERIYAAPRYGIPSEACREAIQRLARTEGILLDPVYTGKAFAGMLDLIDKGCLGSNEPIIFLHTGGLPALFALESGD
jgi:1-aminocyclopropane-1-carboxylate deaminase/D-cysteine desulfhydrase-like pyridoxal-dependent ACC family enzyme